MKEKLKFESLRGSESEIAKMEREIFPKDCWSLECIKESVDFSLFFGEICKCDGDIVGYFGMNIIAGEGYIANIAVTKGYQGKGYGNILLDRLIKECGKKGCEEITLEVRVSNAKAVSLYQKFGFQTEGVRKGFYQDGEDAFVMWKRK